MSFVAAVRSCLSQYATFDGRARRSELWWFYAFQTLIISVPYALAFALVAGGGGRTEQGAPAGPLAVAAGMLILAVAVVLLGLVVPTYAAIVRRLHDTGRSGWWALTNLVPFVGAFVLLVLLVLDSQPGWNAYGPDPRRPSHTPLPGTVLPA